MSSFSLFLYHWSAASVCVIFSLFCKRLLIFNDYNRSDVTHPHLQLITALKLWYADVTATDIVFCKFLKLFCLSLVQLSEEQIFVYLRLLSLLCEEVESLLITMQRSAIRGYEMNEPYAEAMLPVAATSRFIGSLRQQATAEFLSFPVCIIFMLSSNDCHPLFS